MTMYFANTPAGHKARRIYRAGRESLMKIKLYCLCGAYCLGAAEPESAAKKVEDAFRSMHTGPGHGKATAKEAARARRRVAESRR